MADGALAVALASAALILGLALWAQLRRWCFAKTADRETGAQRRSLAPPHVDATAEYVEGCYELEVSRRRRVDNERLFVTLRDGQNVFLQSWSPAGGGEVRAVIVFIHGYSDHCDYFTAMKAKTLCNLGPFAAVAFDLPGHGRSDGIHAHIADWHGLCDLVREVVATHVRPLVDRKWEGAKMFGFGESMGGGVLFTLLAKERALFDGCILVCPMLFVSSHMLPPWLAVQAMKGLARFLPLWPIVPSPDIVDRINVDPVMRDLCLGGAAHHSKLINLAKPRLGSAIQLIFRAGAWMREQIPSFDTPALIIHGGGDTVTDPAVSRDLYERMKHPDRQLLFPDGIWHNDLFHGGPTMYAGCQERFLAVAEWLRARCSGGEV